MTDNLTSEMVLTENPLAPDIFAAGVTSFALFNGVLAITLANPRWNMTEKKFDYVVISRLVLPVAGAQTLALGLHDYLVQNGLDPAAAATQGHSRN